MSEWPEKTMSIVGVPGAGKTDTAVTICEGLVAQQGYEPDEIVMVSYTRAARFEARRRLSERLGLHWSKLPWVSTIHSLCTRLLKRDHMDFMRKRDYLELFDDMKIQYSRDSFSSGMQSLREIMEEPDYGRAEVRLGESLVSWNDYRRNSLLDFDNSLRRFHEMSGVSIPRDHAQDFMDRFDDALTRKHDFTSIVETALREQVFPEKARIVLVDEAQDTLGPQREFIRHLARQTGQVLFFFDEDQLVHEYAGASVEWLLSLPGRRRFLSKSHRCPELVRDIALRIIRWNQKRFNCSEKEWEHAGHRGEIHGNQEWNGALRQVMEAGSVAIIARNKCFLREIAAWMIDAGIPFDNLRGISPYNNIPAAALIALTFASGGSMKLSEFVKLIGDIPQKGYLRRGVRSDLDRQSKSSSFEDRVITRRDLDALGCMPAFIDTMARTETALDSLRMDSGTRRFYTKLYETKGIEWMRNPQITITLGTSHSLKGREFDHVIVLGDCTRRTDESFFNDGGEAERRVAYVAVTRARQSLWICGSNSTYAWRPLQEAGVS